MITCHQTYAQNILANKGKDSMMEMYGGRIGEESPILYLNTRRK